MGRAYAGVLGYLASALTLIRGAISGGGVENTLLSAIASLAIFAVVGYVLGSIAQTTVDGAVRQRMETELQANQSPEAI